MQGPWLLDTSALLSLRDDEPGAERVALLLQDAIHGRARCLACFMTRMDVLYRIWMDEGERRGRLADAQSQSLSIQCLPATDALLEQAAAIKACHALSVADAWIAAAAQLEGAVLVHKDPEFTPLTMLRQEWLS